MKKGNVFRGWLKGHMFEYRWLFIAPVLIAIGTGIAGGQVTNLTIIAVAYGFCGISSLLILWPEIKSRDGFVSLFLIFAAVVALLLAVYIKGSGG